MNYNPYYNPYNAAPYQPVQSRAAFQVSDPPQIQNAQTAAQMPQNGGFLVRPVTSREEAVAAQVDFFGPGTIMPDLSHGIIYLKRFNSQSGSSDFFSFSIEQPKEEPVVQYATKEDIEVLRAEIEALKPRKVVRKNDSDE
ncbi:MAG: hypothetical protein IKU94_00630 [Bacteroidaceae bacterium]|nr:hypothetical protein [Bacteroidaceae bacterium]MBR4930458.1 hypothetical protein [Bacteroidaceae bacterium]